MRPLTIICLFACILNSSAATAQFEASWLYTKGNAIPGWASFWDFAFRIDKGDYISVQPNFEFFGASNPYVWVAPNLVG